MLSGLFGALAGGLLNGISSIFSAGQNYQYSRNLQKWQQYYNERNMNIQQQYNLQSMNQQYQNQQSLNEQQNALNMASYKDSLVNGASYQKQGFKNAGLSPALMNGSSFSPVGQTTGNGSASMGSVGMPSSGSPVANFMSPVDIAGIANLFSQIRNNNKMTEAQVKNIEANTEGKKIENEDKHIGLTFVSQNSKAIAKFLGIDEKTFMSPSALLHAEHFVDLPSRVQSARTSALANKFEEDILHLRDADYDLKKSVAKMPKNVAEQTIADIFLKTSEVRKNNSEATYKDIMSSIAEDNSVGQAARHILSPDSFKDWFQSLGQYVLLGLPSMFGVHVGKSNVSHK